MLNINSVNQCVACHCCWLRNNYERQLYVVRLVRPYQGHADGVSDGELGADSDSDSNYADCVDADESTDDLLSTSEFAADQSSAHGGEHLKNIC